MKTRKLSLAGECQLTNEEEMVELQKSSCEDHHSNNSSKKKNQWMLQLVDLSGKNTINLVDILDRTQKNTNIVDVGQGVRRTND